MQVRTFGNGDRIIEGIKLPGFAATFAAHFSPSRRLIAAERMKSGTEVRKTDLAWAELEKVGRND
jgi:hypothetical protein